MIRGGQFLSQSVLWRSWSRCLCSPIHFCFGHLRESFALQTQIKLHQHIASGFTVLYHNSPLDWFSVVTEEYSTLPFLLLAFAAAIIGSIKGERRLLNLLILAWAVPFALYIAFALVIRPKHFPLPILMPFYSAVPAYFMVFAPPRLISPLGDYLKKIWCSPPHVPCRPCDCRLAICL